MQIPQTFARSSVTEALPSKGCSKCGEVKSLSDFYKHKSTVDGHAKECKACAKARAKAYRDANIELVRERDRGRRRKADTPPDVWAKLLTRCHKENIPVDVYERKKLRARKESKTDTEWAELRAMAQVHTLKANLTEDEWAAKTEYNKVYRDLNREKIRDFNRDWQSRNAKKIKCHRLMWGAIKAGKLLQDVCDVCGSDIVHGHHPDYDKPLDVVWLCPEHHRQWHEANGEGLNGT